MTKALGLLLIILLPCTCFSNSLQKSIVEENDLYIGTHEKNISTVTEEKFNQILDKVFEIYSPIVKAKGGDLHFSRYWESGTVNAYAQRSGRTWKVIMHGGLARHRTVTPDGFTLVVCHEVGHHIGGIPKKSSFFGTMWATNEGQSDYFGSMKCLRKVFENEDNINIVNEMEVDPYAKEKCLEAFQDENEQAICMRSSMAGLSLGNLFKAIKNLETELRFDTPDPRVVSRTYHSHPAPQCRLDTYFAAALCERDAYDDVSDDDINQGVCYRANGDTIGVRPLCWYKPN